MIFLWLSATINLDTTQKIPITLSSTDLNRMALNNGRIAAVYGADIFTVELDEKQGQVFLHVKPDLELPDQVSIALTTEDGLTQDLSVRFTKEAARPVIFNRPAQKASVRDAAHLFFHDVLSGKTDHTVMQENGTSKDYGWAKLTFCKRIVSKAFTVEFYMLRGKKKHCIYNLNHTYFLRAGVCGLWLSDKQLIGLKPVMLAQLRCRP